MVSCFFSRQQKVTEGSLGPAVDIFAPGERITSCETHTGSVSPFILDESYIFRNDNHSVRV